MRIRHSIGRLARALALAAVVTFALAGAASGAVLAQTSQQVQNDKIIRWIAIVVIAWMVMGLTKGKK
jgi:hypothetical protein